MEFAESAEFIIDIFVWILVASTVCGVQKCGVTAVVVAAVTVQSQSKTVILCVFERFPGSQMCCIFANFAS